ncbi:10134_t:CDS:2 [Dentiscutata erythropus]|uniref:10134_t:CDS:1 n=1 Tax=Dentiscutata erythropus TaxID=1348616 RepID=A0A9N9F7J0_9GLOM|nr:10134_t:CDS:2 [Dentiscutata erythropus]
MRMAWLIVEQRFENVYFPIISPNVTSNNATSPPIDYMNDYSLTNLCLVDLLPFSCKKIQHTGLIEDPRPYKLDPDINSNTMFLNISTNNQNTLLSDYFELTIDLDGNQLNDPENLYHISGKHPILRGQWLVLEYSIVIQLYYNDSLKGLFGFNPDKNYIYVDFKEKRVFPLANATYSMLELVPGVPPVLYEHEYTQKTFDMILSEIGGLYIVLISLLTFCFGAPKLSPWNCCQKYSLYRPIRRFSKMGFAKENIPKYKFGIPLGDLENSKENQGIDDLKNRLDALEHLLKDIYLDTNFLESVEKTRKKINEIDEEKAENQNTE